MIGLSLSRLATLTVAGFLLAACSSTTQPADVNVDAGPADVNLSDQTMFSLQVGDRVYFDLDSFAIRPEGMATLQRQAEFLNQKPQYAVLIEGHADERGTREYNLALGERRATAVREALVTFGVDRARVSTISYGKERPECVESNESCWQLNRKGVTMLRGAGS